MALQLVDAMTGTPRASLHVISSHVSIEASLAIHENITGRRVTLSTSTQMPCPSRAV
jgi:hypothetical protein